FENLERWAKERGLAYTSHADLIQLADVKAKMEREVMGGLRDLAKFEMPKKVVLLERDFTIESGELTPSLKVKRRQVEKNYKEMIDRVYAEADPTAATVEGLSAPLGDEQSLPRGDPGQPGGRRDVVALHHQPPPRQQDAVR